MEPGKDSQGTTWATPGVGKWEASPGRGDDLSGKGALQDQLEQLPSSRSGRVSCGPKGTLEADAQGSCCSSKGNGCLNSLWAVGGGHSVDVAVGEGSRDGGLLSRDPGDLSSELVVLPIRTQAGGRRTVPVADLHLPPRFKLFPGTILILTGTTSDTLYSKTLPHLKEHTSVTPESPSW